jgi:ABC-type Fe3+ transport system substrate-binding protein
MPSPVRIYAGTQEGLFVWRSKNGSWDKVTGVQDLPAQVKAQWSYPRPPHREHVRHIIIGFIYNKSMLKPEDAPKSYEDVVNRKWKGKIAMGNPSLHDTTIEWLD